MRLRLEALEREGLAVIVHAFKDVSIFFALEPPVFPVEANRAVLTSHEHSEGFLGKRAAVDYIYFFTKASLPLSLVIIAI